METTTGPLGQGLANAVGMALAEKWLGATFNRPGFDVVDHRTWVFLGDGCLMEGVSHEACSLAGTLKLGKLTAFWDDNGISIDGEVHGWFTDDTPKRFEAYGWTGPTWTAHPPLSRRQSPKAQATGRADLRKTIIGTARPTNREPSDARRIWARTKSLRPRASSIGARAVRDPDDIRRGWDARERGPRGKRSGASDQSLPRRYTSGRGVRRRMKRDLPGIVRRRE